MPAVKRLSVLGLFAVLGCGILSLMDVQPVELHGTCSGYHCSAVAVGQGLQEWRWSWTSHEVDWTNGYDFETTDSARVDFDFTLAAKVPYLLVVSIGAASDTLYWDFSL